MVAVLTLVVVVRHIGVYISNTVDQRLLLSLINQAHVDCHRIISFWLALDLRALLLTSCCRVWDVRVQLAAHHEVWLSRRLLHALSLRLNFVVLE
jgi:hypothetical protein